MSTNRTVSDLFLILVVAPIRQAVTDLQWLVGWTRFFLALAIASRSVK